VRQTANSQDNKEQVVTQAVDFTPVDFEGPQNGDKESLSRVVQAKMAVSSPSDPFEVEAEKVATDFVKRSYSSGGGPGGGSDPSINRSTSSLIARRASGDGLENSGAGLETSAEAAQKISRAAASGGRPLDGATRSRFENGLGADLSAVKVHTGVQSDTLCRSLSADAFSTGRDVFFSSGTFNPGTKSGDHLLAHELTHVVQQGAAPTIARSKTPASAGQAAEGSVFRLTVGKANDPSEDLADEMADKAVASLHRSATRPGTIHRKAADSKDPLGGTQVGENVERAINSQRGKGSSLGAREAEHFSSEYGTDLSGVRVHTDSTADELSRSLQATAFTTGSDVFFSKGSYQPGTSKGDHLIGHELAHVATEGGGAQRSIRRAGKSGAASLLEAYNTLPNKAGKAMISEDVFKEFVDVTWTGKPPQVGTLSAKVKAYQALGNGAVIPAAKKAAAMKLLSDMAADLTAYESGPKEKDDAHRKKAMTDFRSVVASVQLRWTDGDAAAKEGAEQLKIQGQTAKIKAEMEQDDRTVFEKFKDLVIGALTPEIDSVEAELKLEIPASAAISIPVILKGSVEFGDEDEGVSMRASFEMGAKGDVWGASVAGVFGGYLESKGADIKMAAELLGYAFYRRLAESNAPAEIEGYMFGGKAKTRESAAERMAELEQRAFGEEGSEWYAESGFSANAEAEIKAGDAFGMKISGGGTVGTRTDRTSLDMAGIAAGGKKSKDGGSKWNPLDWGVKGINALGGDRGREKTIGRTSAGASVSAELSAPFEAQVTYEGKWLEETVEGENGSASKRVTKLDSRELGAEFTLPSGDVMEKIEPFIEKVFTFLNTVEATTKEKTQKENVAMWGGVVVDEMKSQATDMVKEKASEYGKGAMEWATNTSAGKAIADKAAETAGKAKDYLTSKLPTDLSTGSEEKRAIGIKWDFLNKELSVEFIKSTERKLELPGLEASLKTSSSGGSFKKSFKKPDPKKAEEKK